MRVMPTRAARSRVLLRKILALFCGIASCIAVLFALALVPTAFFGWCPQPNEGFRCVAGGYDEGAAARVWLLVFLSAATCSAVFAAWLGGYVHRHRR